MYIICIRECMKIQGTNIDLFDLNTIAELPEDTECDLIFYSVVWRM